MLGLLLLVNTGAAVAVDYSLVPRVAPKLLKIQALAADGRVSIGTGVMVASDTVVTNCHVTRNATHIEIWSGGQRFVASRQAADLDRDL
jgi:S1-C subfamily serine protease